MNQTLALLIDAYRELNSKKLFWITLVLSVVVLAAFALVGISGSNLNVLGFKVPFSAADPIELYKLAFSILVIGIWLTWAAVALALISTAGIFPDLISGGTIDLYLSKPLSRLRLFLTKYLTGLLFVTLQVTVFALGSFIVFGVRAHEWRPSLFLAVPLVVCMFSYLFGFCVFLGVTTRSTIAALLSTVVIWLCFWGIQKADGILLTMDVLTQKQVDHARQIIASTDADLAKGKIGNMFDLHTYTRAIDRKTAVEQLPDLESNLARIHFFHRLTYVLKTLIPKTTETTNMLDRYLFSDDEVHAGEQTHAQHSPRPPGPPNSPFGADDETLHEAGVEVQGILRTTSPWYIIGTSLLCEAFVVGAAAWIFCRRDY